MKFSAPFLLNVVVFVGTRHVAEVTTTPPNERIVGGEAAVDEQFPWQVAINYDTPSSSFFCGGALIDLHWVVTAGHCVYQAIGFVLHFGSNSLLDYDPHRITIRSNDSVVHPGYVHATLENDVGLIKIDNIRTSERVAFIALRIMDLDVDVPVIISGWGAVSDKNVLVNQLNFVRLRTISNSDCKAIYGQSVVTDSMVCAVGNTTEGACNGDSGSPLVNIDALGHPALVGTASWASAYGCETNHPSGYARTAHHYNWISSVILGP